MLRHMTWRIGSSAVRDLLRNLMDAAAGRAEYADARFVHSRSERLATRNGEVERVESEESEGVGVRVRVGGAWGFAAVRGTARAEAEAALQRALDVAAAQPATPATPLAPEPPAVGSYEVPIERDPFEVAQEDKLAVLHAADAALRAESAVAVSLARFQTVRVHKLFA